MQKVVQAAGRVIRTREDRGTVMLIDDRFAESRIQQLLPRWWAIKSEPALFKSTDSRILQPMTVAGECDE
jgi:Rad3-related DNA helicase